MTLAPSRDYLYYFSLMWVTPCPTEGGTIRSALSRQLASKISNSMLDTLPTDLYRLIYHISADGFTREFANILSNYNPLN